MGAPYMYSDTLVMMAAGLRVALGVRYRQIQVMVGRMVGNPTPPYSASCTSGSAGLARISTGIQTAW